MLRVRRLSIKKERNHLLLREGGECLRLKPCCPWSGEGVVFRCVCVSLWRFCVVFKAEEFALCRFRVCLCRQNVALCLQCCFGDGLKCVAFSLVSEISGDGKIKTDGENEYYQQKNQYGSGAICFLGMYGYLQCRVPAFVKILRVRGSPAAVKEIARSVSSEPLHYSKFPCGFVI